MSSVPKQHYVPQGYLRRFTHDGDRLWVFDKPTRRAFGANVADVASSTRFYDLPREALPPDCSGQEVDAWFTSIEGRLNELIGSLVALPVGQRIRAEWRHDLAFLVTIQYLRTREQRTRITEVTAKLAQVVADTQLPPETAPDPHAEPLNHAAFILYPGVLSTIMGILKSHVWFLGINESEMPLYTSDAPVVKHCHLPHPGAGVGIGSRGIEIDLPLSPTRILVMADRCAFRDPDDGGPLVLGAENVTWYNCLQVHQSYRQVYCSAKDFGLADSMCREQPALCDPSRERTEVLGALD